jgi:hypothetical protein
LNVSAIFGTADDYESDLGIDQGGEQPLEIDPR